MRLFDKSNEALGKWTAVYSLALLHLSVLVTSAQREKLVTYGEHIKIEKMPHSVAVIIAYKWPTRMTYCSGTIITRLWVLTAAHCVIDTFAPVDYQIKVRFGIDDYSQDGEVANVNKTICHEGFFGFMTANDICLLQTSYPIPLSDAVRPAIRPQPNETLQSVTEVSVAGWGMNEVGNDQFLLSAVRLAMISNSDCEKALERNLSEENPDTFFCAGKGGHEPKGICLGDSGAGAVFKRHENSSWIIFGIAVQGNCTGAGIFIYVPYYSSWIGDTIWNNP